MFRRIFLPFTFFPRLLFAGNNKQVQRCGIDISKRMPKGLNIGDKAPLINAVSSDGERILSDEILEEKKIVLIFYRGKWCPICNKHLSNLVDALEPIYEKAEIIVVGPETFKNAGKSLKKAGGGFILIPDTSLKILSDYDVLFNVNKQYLRKVKLLRLTNIARYNHQEDAILPIPATYIIDETGVITYKHFDYDFNKRASVREILENI